MAKIFLLKIWWWFPGWLQAVASRIIRPLFQVFAAAVIFDRDGGILLVKLTYQRQHPWGLPGGSLEYGETPEEGIRREVREETGWEIEIEKLLCVKTWAPDRVGLYYLCRIVDGEFQPSDEVSEFGYFGLKDLPDVRPLDVELIEQIYEQAEHELA
ncbi:MAG: NUDIX domain-containing protein [Chloroflexi bacterium]|jgi:ADP-ribose pyrophosphatase YjhB (NUDIX family)|nr:NUDIX domain-containing protein [Chloroflexota bacterium]